MRKRDSCQSLVLIITVGTRGAFLSKLSAAKGGQDVMSKSMMTSSYWTCESAVDAFSQPHDHFQFPSFFFFK